MQRLPGLTPLLPDYDLLLVDLWGVIHDGTALYPGVAATLAGLKAADKRILFLSNAPRRATEAAERLARLGIEPALYDGIVTSGEVTFHSLRNGQHPIRQHGAENLCFIGAERDRGLLVGLGMPEQPVEQADCILNAGFDDEEQLEDANRYDPLLHQAALRGLPMLCANPDRHIVKQDGAILPCAGLLADRYLALGGEVHWVGKPYPEIYRFALAHPAAEGCTRPLAIGDNMETDIAGAAAVGMDSVLIAGGLLAVQYPLAADGLPTAEQWADISAAHPHAPQAMLPRFVL